jgi:hypothetical protein
VQGTRETESDSLRQMLSKNEIKGRQKQPEKYNVYFPTTKDSCVYFNTCTMHFHYLVK